jgi:short-chain fatty acids transporter
VSGALSRIADASARASARYVPDSFSIAAVLTLLTLILGMTLGGASPGQAVRAWGGGVWTLLPLSMQIALIVFTGYVLAVSPAVRRLLEHGASLPRTPPQAAAFAALASMLLCWLNWGVGLIASAVLVRTLARRHPDADYRLLVAMAYVGMGTTWHGGPSGSVPLLLATPNSFMIRDGLIAAPIPLSQTVGTPLNLALMVAAAVSLTVLAFLLHPPPGRVVRADVHALAALETFEAPGRPTNPTPAERLMHGPSLTRLMAALALGYVILEVLAGRFASTLDSVNLVVLSLALLLHRNAASFMKAAEEAARPLHGIVLQFPLYAGIYGIIKDTGLATALANAFLSVASTHTYPFIVFVYSAVLNYWVPSGGAKWAMEAPYLLQAASRLGVGTPGVAMAYAYGDMATNLIQPFWAIPLLGVARLEFRDILGYELLVILVYAVLVSGALLVFS